MSTDAMGSPWTLSLDHARALGERGVEVVLVAMGRKLTNEQRRTAWDISTLTLHEQPLRSEWMSEPWDDVEKVGEFLLELEQRYTPDVVQLGSYAHGALPFRCPVILSAHSCLPAWWEASHHTPLPREFDRFCERAREGLQAADAVICATTSVLQQLAHYHGPVAGRIISGACDQALFSPDEKEACIFSASHSWDGVRNLQLLTAAAEHVRWPIAIAADDTRPPEHVPRPEAEPSGVHLLGQLSRASLAEHLGRAAIYTLPGGLDPTGLPVLEAALSGCALVLEDNAYLREMWQGTAVFVKPESPAHLSAALNELAADGARMSSLAHLARQRALAHSPWASVDAHLALYDELQSDPRQVRSRRGGFAQQLRARLGF
jgi:glycosyltransferase involved in cell wall biosynthesis